MKISTAVAIAAAMLGAILGTALPAEAATKKDRNTVLAEREASCKAKAAQKYSAIHFLARREYINRCMGWNVQEKAQARAAKPKPKKNAKAS